MKKINLAITGCMGRMGQQLIKSSKSNNNFRLVALTENRIINKKFNGIKPESNTDKAFEKTDVIVDFTVPKCTMEILKIASKLKKKVVIGTTGFSSKEEKIIKNYSKKIPNLKVWQDDTRIFYKECISISNYFDVSLVINALLAISLTCFLWIALTESYPFL
mgnify:CR=1 FL=1